jgi:hypothetical protein
MCSLLAASSAIPVTIKRAFQNPIKNIYDVNLQHSYYSRKQRWLNKRKKMWSKIMSTAHSITCFGWRRGKVCLISPKTWLGVWSISSGAQYGTLQTSPEVSPNGSCKLIFFAFKFNCLLFSTSPIKLKLGEQIGRGAINSSRLNESLWLANQKHWVGAQHCNAIYQTPQIMLLCSAKTSFLSITAKSSFLSQTGTLKIILHPILVCRTTHWASLEMLLGLLQYMFIQDYFTKSFPHPAP